MSVAAPQTIHRGAPLAAPVVTLMSPPPASLLEQCREIQPSVGARCEDSSTMDLLTGDVISVAIAAPDVPMHSPPNGVQLPATAHGARGWQRFQLSPSPSADNAPWQPTHRASERPTTRPRQ